MTAKPLSEITAEALRLSASASEQGICIRILGGVAVGLHASEGVHPALIREYRDIDLVAPRRTDREVLRLLLDAGYESNKRFNDMVGVHGRLVVYDTANGRQLDVFVGEFSMCHALPLADRLLADSPTVPLAELLLTKLQIVKLNEKDVRDIAAIVLDHDVAEHDREAVNAAHVAQLLSGDWGLWRTCQGSLSTARATIPTLGLEPERAALVDDRLGRLWERVETQPKSLKWKARARVGERTRWYQEPDEIGHRELNGST